MMVQTKTFASAVFLSLVIAAPALAFDWRNPMSIFEKSPPAHTNIPVVKHSVVPTENLTYAEIETQRGNLFIRLYPKEAPKTVDNFVSLVKKGFYNQNGMTFHRVIPGFVAQTGDPTGTGEGGSEHKIPLEVQNKLSHDGKGVVAMARGYDPNSATSQFYLTLDSQRSLDGKYAIFGRVVRGLPILSTLHQGDALYGVKLVSERELPPPDPTVTSTTMVKIKSKIVGWSPLK